MTSENTNQNSFLTDRPVAILMVFLAAVVFGAVARWRNAAATSSALTSRPKRLPLTYSVGVIPRASARASIISSLNSPDRIRSALTAFDRMPSAPWSSAYCFMRKSVAAFGRP